MNESHEYTLEDLFAELRPPYEDQAHLANMLNTLKIYLERPWCEDTSLEVLSDGFRPVLAEYLGISEDAREELLACLCHLFDPDSEEEPELDLSIIKDSLEVLAPSGLVVALSLISNERAPDAEARIRPFLQHEKEFVREAAREELEELGL